MTPKELRARLTELDGSLALFSGAERFSRAAQIAEVRAKLAGLPLAIAAAAMHAIALDALALGEATAPARDSLAEAQARRDGLDMALALIRQALALAL